MTHAITLDLPEEVYEPLKRTAKDNGQSPEDLAVKWLTTVVQRLSDDPLEQLYKFTRTLLLLYSSSSSNKTFASCRSAVSKPSVNQL